jgi:hypothetical protein
MSPSLWTDSPPGTLATRAEQVLIHMYELPADQLSLKASSMAAPDTSAA